jgi:hypothetical protein
MPVFHSRAPVSHGEPSRRYDPPMAKEPIGGRQRKVILCDTCARYVLEQFSVARVWQEGRRCVVGMRFAGERTECPYYIRDPGSDDE